MGLLAESQGARLLYGACPPGEERPYQAVSEALQSAIPMLVNPAQDTLRLAALAVLLPALHQHLSLPNLPPLVPEREQLRLFDAVATSLEKLAAPHPLFIIFEDLHWAGLSTLALIEFLARRAAHTPLLLVVTYRDEEVQRTHPLRALLRRLQIAKENKDSLSSTQQAYLIWRAWIAQFDGEDLKLLKLSTSNGASQFPPYLAAA